MINEILVPLYFKLLCLEKVIQIYWFCDVYVTLIIIILRNDFLIVNELRR